MIKLEIDYREKALIKNLDDKNVSYEINNLEVVKLSINWQNKFIDLYNTKKIKKWH